MVIINEKIRYYKSEKNISAVQNMNVHFIKTLAEVLTVVLEEKNGNDTG